MKKLKNFQPISRVSLKKIKGGGIQRRGIFCERMFCVPDMPENCYGRCSCNPDLLECQ